MDINYEQKLVNPPCQAQREGRSSFPPPMPHPDEFGLRLNVGGKAGGFCFFASRRTVPGTLCWVRCPGVQMKLWCSWRSVLRCLAAARQLPVSRPAFGCRKPETAERCAGYFICNLVGLLLGACCLIAQFLCQDLAWSVQGWCKVYALRDCGNICEPLLDLCTSGDSCHCPIHIQDRMP